MPFPLVSEYVEAIKSAEDNFEELSYLRPVLGDDELPVMTGGNFAEIFKMKDERDGKFYAVKCFTKEQEGRAEAYREIAKELKDVSSPYLVSFRYLENELFVDTNQTTETEFPVLLMDWVEGKTLDKYLRENLDDKYALEMLAYRFSQLAQWLIPQPFAHGDLKPDNILVREDGTLVLVDYDGMYVPAMKGQKARELGSPDFRHPQRTEDDFDEHIDDFPIVSILLSLRAISSYPRILSEYGGDGRLLFKKEDYLEEEIERCSVLYLNSTIFSSKDLENTLIAFKIVWLWKKIKKDYIFLLKIDLPLELLLYYREETNNRGGNYGTIKDEYGGEYSRDGKHLIAFSRYSKVNNYRIKDGTEIICNYAFRFCDNLEKIDFPNSLKAIGYNAFFSCRNLKNLELNSGIEYVGDFVSNSLEVIIPESVKFIDTNALRLSNADNLILPKSLIYLGTNPFYGSTIKKITNQSPLYETDGSALYTKGKTKLIYFFSNAKKYRFPVSVTEMDVGALDKTNIKFKKIPICLRYKLVRTRIEKTKSKKTYTVPDGVIYIPKWSFEGFPSLKSVKMPSSIEYIDDWYLRKYTILIPKGFLSKFETILRDNRTEIKEYDGQNRDDLFNRKTAIIAATIISCILLSIVLCILFPPILGYIIYCLGIIIGLLVGSIVAYIVGSKDGCDSVGCALLLFILCLYWGFRIAGMIVEKYI